VTQRTRLYAFHCGTERSDWAVFDPFVEHVVQTHLHFDHAGGLQWFRHATIYVQASELPFAYAHYLVEKMRARLLPSVVWNPDAMVASWQRIEELETRHGAELISTHDPEFATRVRLAPGGWYE
jgi:Metallo-beta-lactamase superfamily